MANLDRRTKLLTGHTTAADIVASNGVWTLTIDATGGTYTAKVNGTVSAAISATAAASTVKTALVATDPNLDSDSVTVTGGPGNAGGTTPYTVTIVSVEDADIPTFDTLTTGSLTGGGATGSIVQTSVPGVQAAHQTSLATPGSAYVNPLGQQVGPAVGNPGAKSPASTYV